jgi:hypothetical protein
MKRSKLAHSFDIDSGYLAKSPCRDRGTYGSFPDCLDRCKTIDYVQATLTAILPTGPNPSDLENYTVL